MERTGVNSKGVSFRNRKSWSTGAAILALGVALSAAPLLAQQDRSAPPDQSAAPAPQDQQSQPAPPPAAQQDQNMPQQQSQPDQQQSDQPAPPPQDQQGQAAPPAPPDQQNQQDQSAPPPPADQSGPQTQAPPPQPPPQERRVPPPLAPETLTVPAGTIIQVRTSDWLSSDHNHVGDQFIATLAQPIVVDGWVVMRRGQTINGEVTDAKRAGRVKGVSRLQLGLKQLTLVDGQLLPVQTSLLNASAGTSNGRDAAAIGITTGTGAAIGAAAAGGSGAAIGAGAGFVASVAGVLLTRGKPTIIPPEDVLTFKLENPVTITTTRGQLAFRPVTQADYAQTQRPNNRPRLRPYLRPYYPYPYPYPCCGYYPAYYGYYGWR
jgi:hypothetical protein